MDQTQGESIVAMQSDIKHLTKSFDEFKAENREYHDDQSKRHDTMNQKLEDLVVQWTRIGGFVQSLSDLSGRINKIEKELETNYVRQEKVVPVISQLFELKENIEKSYPRKEELEPIRETLNSIKKIVYGVSSVIGIGVITQVLSLIFKE